MPFFCSLFVHNGPPTCHCLPESASISSWALNHLSQHVLIMTTLTTCDDIMNNLSTFSQFVLIMLHIATDSCLLSLFSCRMHGCNYHSVIRYIISAIGYIIKHHQCYFCYHMHKYFMFLPTMAFSMMELPLTCANRARKSVYFLRKTKMADGRLLVFRRALLG